MSAPTTRLESALYLADAVTLTLTVDPGGTPRVSAYTLPAGTLLASVTEFLYAWNNEIVSDLVGAGLGSGSAAVCQWHIDQYDDGGATVSFHTHGPTWSCDFDGSDIAGWLGFAGNVAAAASGTAGADNAPGVVWPLYGAQQLVYTSRARQRAQRHTLDGSVETAHGAASDAGVSESDRSTVSVSLLATENQAGAGDPGYCQTRLDTWLDWMAEHGTGLRFSVVHGLLALTGAPTVVGATIIFGRAAGEAPRWEWQRSRLAAHWTLGFELETLEAVA